MVEEILNKGITETGVLKRMADMGLAKSEYYYRTEQREIVDQDDEGYFYFGTVVNIHFSNPGDELAYRLTYE